jgi:hypothetical protein
MNTALYIGVVSKDDALEVVAREHGQATVSMTFPATVTGVEALRSYMTSRERRIRLAVAGAAALGIALTLGNAPLRETFIVSSGFAGHATELARYAEHAV